MTLARLEGGPGPKMIDEDLHRPALRRKLRQVFLGNCAVAVALLHITDCSSLLTGTVLRIAETLPVTAQSPSETSTLLFCYLVDLFYVFVGTHRSLNEGDIDFLGKLVGVNQRAIHQLDLASHRYERGVEVEQGHVASGTAIQPDGRDLSLLMARTPLLCASEVMNLVIFHHLLHALAFLGKRPGRASLTHLPQFVQLDAAPQRLLSSDTSRALLPRFATSHTWAPSMSAHTRTQRVHRMQRL